MAKKKEELISYIRHLKDLEMGKANRDGVMFWATSAALIIVAWKTLIDVNEELLAQGTQVLMLTMRLVVVTVLVRLFFTPASLSRIRAEIRKVQEDTTGGALVKIAHGLLLPGCLSVALFSFEFANTLVLILALLAATLMILVHSGQRRGCPLPPRLESLGHPLARTILVLLMGIAIMLEGRALFGLLGDLGPLANFAVPFNLSVVFWLVLLGFEKVRPSTSAEYLQHLEQGLLLFGHDEEETQQKLEVHLLGPGLSTAVEVKWKQIEDHREGISNELQGAGARIADMVGHAEGCDTAETEAKVRDIADAASAACNRSYDEMKTLVGEMRRILDLHASDSSRAGIFEAQAKRADRLLEETKNSIDAVPQYFKNALQKGGDSESESLF